MDDLYQNAWSETNDTSATFKSDSTPSWPPHKPTNSLHEEADLAAPSWSTGTGINWDEPTGSPGFSWSHAEGDAGWGPSTYEGISLGKSTVKIEQDAVAPDTPPPAAEDDLAFSPPAEDVGWGTITYEAISFGKPMVEVDHVTDLTPDASPPTTDYTIVIPASPTTPTSSVSSSPPQSSPPVIVEPVVVPIYDPATESAPHSPDGFGTFESGLTEDDAVPSPGFALNDAETDPWGPSAWGSTQVDDQEDEPVDEWERAKREKAKQDRRVPPELLAEILRQCEDLAREICPEPAEQEVPSEKDAWRNDRRSGMEAVPGLHALTESFLPPLTLQPRVRFPEALVAKRMATSVKLTKSLSLARDSPMSHYLAAKGSTAWETSVKKRKEVVEDDVPVGWRIVDKATSTSTTDPAKDKRTGGRLFSFWGRRQSQAATASSLSTEESIGRPSSIDKPQSPVVGEIKSESRPPSQDSVRSSMAGSSSQLPSPLGETKPSQLAPVPDPTPTLLSYTSTADPVSERSGSPPAPSAVSRFLNRFSRRTSVGGSPRNSLALSSDDIEFLSDIVPSAADDDDTADALVRFVNVKRDSVPSALPPPLAPPPKAPAVRPSSAASNSPGATSPANDLDILFGSLSSSTSTTTPSVSLVPGAKRLSIPTLPPPLAPSRSATPAGVSGPSNPTAVVSSSSLSRPPSRLQTSTPLAGFALPPPPSFKPVAPSTARSKPKLASPFPFSPRPASEAEPGPMSASSTSSASYETAAESSPASPTSSLPLSELYPHAATPNTPAQHPGQALFDDGIPSRFPGLSPATSTPAGSFFASTKGSFLRPPTQSENAISPTAAPLKSSLFDDDDFSDFQSPVEPPSHTHTFPPVPAPVAKSPRTLTAAKAANAALRTPPTGSHTTSTLSPSAIPPPSSSSQAGPSSAAAVITNFDDDDFMDFQTSPMSPPDTQLSSSSSLFSNSASDAALLTPKNSMNFTAFDDFLGGNALATPSPPRVPAKPSAIPPLQPPPAPSQSPPAVLPPPPSSRLPTASASAPSLSSASSSTSLLSRRDSKKRVEHLNTRNLVERAAARSGQQWPAPPSPLPAIIPGPPGDGTAKGRSSLFDIMDEDAPTAAAAPSFSSPTMLNPVRPSSAMGPGVGFAALNSSSTVASSLNGSQSNPLLQSSSWASSSFGSLQMSTSPPAYAAMGSSSLFATPAKSANGNENASRGKGGLSAQDLSFFEGL
ncbi:hypothetical protein C8Q80DRAFT_1194370 [Daedaleopsis nitida]|nr:hypothetical protein C8Q80DRAFT_1194370 [Daedaleopsis nitida]